MQQVLVRVTLVVVVVVVVVVSRYYYVNQAIDRDTCTDSYGDALVHFSMS